MAQNYKVYFANRPVFFTQDEHNALPSGKGIAVFDSNGKHDTLLIESAIAKGAKSIYVQCKDVEAAWKTFSKQFEFVQAAGGLVLNAKHELLFIYRMEKWDLPKGKVEDGETLVEGALREVEEECSIAPLQPIQKLCTTWHTYIQKGLPILKATEWYLMAYAGTKTPAPQLAEGITKTQWLKADQLEIVKKNTYPSVMDVLASHLKKNSADL